MAERPVNHLRPKASSGLPAVEVGNAELSAVGGGAFNGWFGVSGRTRSALPSIGFFLCLIGRNGAPMMGCLETLPAGFL